MRSGPWLVAGTLFLVSLIACAPKSEVPRDAAVRIDGRVVDAAGRPLPEAKAVLLKEIGPEEFAAGAISVVFMGFTCLEDPDVEPCGEFAHRGQADADGRVTFDVTGADVQSGLGSASTMTLMATAPDRAGTPGAAVAHSFRIQKAHFQVPVNRLWQPRMGLRRSDAGLAVSAPRLPKAYGPATSYATLYLEPDGRMLWRSRPGVPVDERVLEDATGTVTVEAEAGERGAVLRSVYRSDHIAVKGPGAPPSRGALCLASSRGRSVVRYSPCPLTDGDFTTSFDPALDPRCPAGRTCPRHDTEVTVDLGQVRRTQAVAIRGQDDVLIVRTSADGSAWSPPTTVKIRDGHAWVKLPTPTPARYVRVKAKRWPLPSLAEISVW